MALTKDDLLAIKAIFKEEIKPIEKRLDTMDKRFDGMDKRFDGMDKRLNSIEEVIAEIKEDTEITRVATNSLVQWADTVATVTQIKFPVEQTK